VNDLRLRGQCLGGQVAAAGAGTAPDHSNHGSGHGQR
jgi:hypothetical protein